MSELVLSNYSDRNKKIASLRGDSWKRKLREAKATQKGTAIKAMALTRLDLNLTQKDMMQLLKFNNITLYARIERGDVTTNKRLAETISKHLNKKVTDLFIEFDKDRFVAI